MAGKLTLWKTGRGARRKRRLNDIVRRVAKRVWRESMEAIVQLMYKSGPLFPRAGK